jgi:gamma-glutamylputrescine oxidase
VRALIKTYEIECDLRNGVAWAGSSDRTVRDLHGYADHMVQH